MLLKCALAFISFAAIFLPPISGHGSCRESRLCCTGRDSSCFVQKNGVNAVIEEPDEEKSCYCDHACITLGDCCDDYTLACGVTDCQLSEWGPWSECDVECGLGTMSRQRKVIRPAQNGGKECDELVQKRGCHGHKCESRATAKASRGMQIINCVIMCVTRFVSATQILRCIPSKKFLRKCG
ncbi:uncharacterized protein B4U80_07591 [Leptotrombidium deliense]|uniref:SMB domain-containing protein n=1 Tax=Leptotrombidium deliense TaxID=299467 RepID=A0A443S8M7_9ACAR|nr:uncharacterized protein B4U80_07591 [Leptotrombidium deliense]